MKTPLRVLMLTSLATSIDEARMVIDVRTPKPHPADSLPPPLRDNEKIRAAEAKRERRRKRGW